jgi:hypothetical protein
MKRLDLMPQSVLETTNRTIDLVRRLLAEQRPDARMELIIALPAVRSDEIGLVDEIGGNLFIAVLQQDSQIGVLG